MERPNGIVEWNPNDLSADCFYFIYFLFSKLIVEMSKHLFHASESKYWAKKNIIILRNSLVFIVCITVNFKSWVILCYQTKIAKFIGTENKLSFTWASFTFMIRGPVAAIVIAKSTTTSAWYFDVMPYDMESGASNVEIIQHTVDILRVMRAFILASMLMKNMYIVMHEGKNTKTFKIPPFNRHPVWSSMYVELKGSL